MDGSRFDALARRMAGEASRRGFVGGLLGLGAGLLGVRTTTATTCPPGQVYRPRVGCICRATGRPPVGGACPCPRGQTDTGDGQGCVACRGDRDCPATQSCLPGGTCGCAAPRVPLSNGSCGHPCTPSGLPPTSAECDELCGGSAFCVPVADDVVVGQTYCVSDALSGACGELNDNCPIGNMCTGMFCAPLC